jgi:hypothetical protein
MGKGIRPGTKSPTRRHTGRGAESIAPLPAFFHLIVEKRGAYPQPPLVIFHIFVLETQTQKIRGSINHPP